MNTQYLSPEDCLQVRQGDGDLHFVYKKSSPFRSSVIPVVSASALALVALVPLVLFEWPRTYSLLYLVFFLLLLIAMLRSWYKRNGKGSFSMGPRSFKVNGREYDRNEVFELFLKAPGRTLDVYRIYSPALPLPASYDEQRPGGNGQAALQESLEGCTVGIIYGESRVKLASGLKGRCAAALLQVLVEQSKVMV